TLRDAGGQEMHKMSRPLLKTKKPGKAADIIIHVEEGKLYHVNKMNFAVVKLFRTTGFLQKNVFQMNDGDVFSTARLRKGIEQMKKIYAEFHYIDVVLEPTFDIIAGTEKVDLTLTA